ncbi:NB-ARC domain-containing protein [Ralstonia pseudosolanacearum]|uniref:NB-ARC domain-containing protein n=1 Tax=Ralstonia pseudosolanacearum TaxID=1310165 RepID=UPI003CF68F14
MKGASDEKKKIFEVEQVFVRDGDNSIACSKPAHWRLIYGDRQNPYLASELVPTSPPLHSNLPDRSSIYQSFVGRQDTLATLWQWLGDDFSCVRVLAGEGGLGKTSIAYEFAQDICKTKPCDFVQVVWLTAKKEQFRAMDNGFEAMPVTHYDSAPALFRQILIQLGMFEVETAEVPDSALPKRMRDTVAKVRSFIVVDDLDSLSPDHQKRAIEVCQQMANTGTRFLFTTRKNATASSVSAIELEGFVIDDFKTFVDGWTERLKLAKFSDTQIKKIIGTTRGSPLYTESFLRLLKMGVKFSEALSSWAGKLGSDVRKAALEREVTQLSQEARKVIVAAAVRGGASYAELKQATDYSDQTLQDCVNELQSLFLLSAPQIAKQKRFSVPQTTRELVLSIGTELIPDFDAFTTSIKAMQYKPSKKASEKEPLVGAAINQAMALLKQGQADIALKTIDEVNAYFGGKHADLLFMRGRVLTQILPFNWTEVRRAYRDAYDNGQRKDQFFEHWYSAEVSDKHYEGAIEVCIKAIANDAGDKGDWLRRRASARFQSSATHESTGDRDHAISQLRLATVDLVEARHHPSNDTAVVAELPLEFVHDKQWTLLTSSAKQATEWIEALDAQIEAAQRGDERIDVYERMVATLYQLKSLFDRQVDGPTPRQYALLDHHQQRVQAQLKSARRQVRNSERFAGALKVLDDVANRSR